MAELAQLTESRPLQFELLQESHHRITNQLALLIGMVRLESQTLRSGPPVMTRESAAVLLNDITARIMSVSQFHRRLVCRPQSTADNLPALLARCCSDLSQTLALSDRVRFRYVFTGDCEITGDEAFAIGLLVSEIAMNSIKHAKPDGGGPVELSINCSVMPNGRPEIEISDNGGGLPKDFEEARDGGAGFQLIRKLACSIGAAIVEQSDDLGLSFRIVLRKRRPDSAHFFPIAAVSPRPPRFEYGVWANQLNGGVRRRKMPFHV